MGGSVSRASAGAGAGVVFGGSARLRDAFMTRGMFVAVMLVVSPSLGSWIGRSCVSTGRTRGLYACR
jgi:hypothetical protein